MAKKIFFSGLKGGTGKTMLSVNFANYMFFYMRKKVVLISFDFQQHLTFFGEKAPYKILEKNISSDKQINEIIEEIKGFDIAIFDIPSGLEQGIINLHQLADIIAIPFEYTLTDYFKVIGLLELLNRKGIKKDIIKLIPNKQDRHENIEIKLWFNNESVKSNFGDFTPSIHSSYKFKAFKFCSPSRDCFYLLRPTFQFLTNAIYSNTH